MKLPALRSLRLHEGVLAEPMPDDSRIVLWVPGGRDGDYRLWERVGNVARAEVTVEQGICATPANAIRARQRVRGLFGKLLQRFQKGTGGQSWTLPNGQSAEQCGERQTDLVLVWAEDESTPLDESRVRSRLPEGKEFRKIGDNLFLVSGIEPPKAAGPEAPPTQECPRREAEQLLAAARQAGDRRREAYALTDLGMILQREGDAQRAFALHQEALAIAQQLGDRSAESDVVGNLGLAALSVGQPQYAYQLFEHKLGYANATGDRFGAKIALNGLGLTYTNLGDPARAIASFEKALVLAREIGDRKHETELLWYLATQHAELGQRDQAIARAQESVDLQEKMGKPQARWFADHLRRYRTGDAGAGLGGAGEAGAAGTSGAFFGESIVASVWGAPAGPQTTPGSPGLLRMALTAARSMAKFLGSGLKTVSSETHQKRLRTCASCEHHTGLRCRVCGCFTNAKAWMPHEECPIGKWPAQKS
jgi:tetratricopeptide (TPR) repeat protein